MFMACPRRCGLKCPLAHGKTEFRQPTLACGSSLYSPDELGVPHHLYLFRLLLPLCCTFCHMEWQLNQLILWVSIWVRNRRMAPWHSSPGCRYSQHPREEPSTECVCASAHSLPAPQAQLLRALNTSSSAHFCNGSQAFLNSDQPLYQVKLKNSLSILGSNFSDKVSFSVYFFAHCMLPRKCSSAGKPHLQFQCSWALQKICNHFQFQQ